MFLVTRPAPAASLTRVTNSGDNPANLDMYIWWNGVNTGTTGAVSVRDAAHHGTVAPSGTTAFGFVADGDGAAAPSAVSRTSP
ncbi:hypothetical protein ABGB17_38650 [Sphaerisporangium sp. B11E5]|uniref:hypothetical protein n=1 Tax=Sphaerisporangium sp. B11E5 TaxID=3153563 RepID=UPI00325DEC84